MKFLWNIAAKNLVRNKLRSSVSIMAIALSVIMVVFTRGLVLGMFDSMVEMHIQYSAGHIKIIDEEYLRKERLLSLNSPVDGFEGEGVSKMAQELQELPGVERAIQRLKFGAATTKDDKMFGMMAWGINPDDEKVLTDIEENLVEGRLVHLGEQEAVLGGSLLDELKLQVGDKFTIFYTTSFGSFKGMTLKIVGRIESGLKLLDDNTLYVPLDLAQRILEMPDQVTELLLVTPNYKKVKPVVKEVQDYFATQDVDGRYKIMPWNKFGALIGLAQVADKVYNVVYILLVILASFVVINTMLMIVKERTAEIGMMSALGLKSRDILALFVLEGTVMGIVGSFIGVVLGGILTKVISVVGIDYTEALSGMSADLMMKSIIYPTFTFENLVFSFILGVVVTAVTCIFPARKASKLEPTEALRA